MIKLREYQLNLIEKSRELLSQGHRMIMIVLATGGGKSVIEANILKSLYDNGNKGWLLTHRYEIFKQLVQHCINQDVSPGQIISGQRVTANKIQVAMIQTLYKKMKYLKNVWPDLIIHDEAHHGSARTHTSILNFKDTTKIIGFTATPARTDGAGLNMAGYTAMIEGPQTNDLINAGFLTQMVVLSSRTTVVYREQKFKKSGKEYDKEQQTAFTTQKYIVQDTVNSYNQYFNGAPCIIFCCSVQDCEVVANEMKKAGWKCEAIHEKIDKDLRTKYIDSLGTGELNCITSYDIIGEGVDVPILAGVIIRRLTCSLINWLQWVGRALRKSPGKEKAIIIDQAGNIFDHGHPQIYRKWSLNGTAELKEESDIQIKQCQYCGCINIRQATFCVGCGERLSKITPEKELNIKVINEPLIEIKPPIIPVGNFAIDQAELITHENDNLEREIINRIKNINQQNDPSARERLEILGKYFGKSSKWTEYVWNNFINKG